MIECCLCTLNICVHFWMICRDISAHVPIYYKALFTILWTTLWQLWHLNLTFFTYLVNVLVPKNGQKWKMHDFVHFLHNRILLRHILVVYSNFLLVLILTRDLLGKNDTGLLLHSSSLINKPLKPLLMRNHNTLTIPKWLSGSK